MNRVGLHPCNTSVALELEVVPEKQERVTN